MTADGDLVVQGILRALDEYGQYHELVAAGDDERLKELRLVAEALEGHLDRTIGFAAVPRPRGALWVCLRLDDPDPRR